MQYLKEIKEDQLQKVIDDFLIRTPEDDAALCKIIHKVGYFKTMYEKAFVMAALNQSNMITPTNFGCMLHIGMELGYSLAHKEIDDEILEKEMLIPIL